MTWQMGVIVEGERLDTPIKSNGMVIAFADYRDDPGYIDPQQQMQMEEIDQMANQDLKEMARIALSIIPDVSTDAVAEALGLSRYAVRPLSSGRDKRKKKGMSKNVELSWYSREEILGAIRAYQQNSI